MHELTFTPVTRRVHAARCRFLDVNSVLVTGTIRALLIDTCSTGEQGRALAVAVREVTGLPVDILNTHAHFDHWFGNHTTAEALGTDTIYAHPACITEQHRKPARLIGEAVDGYGHLDAAVARDMLATRLRPAGRAVTDTSIDLGDLTVHIGHHGPAHTTGDLTVHADGALIAGDLVEEGAEPDTDGADIPGWISTLDTLTPTATGPVIPGHGGIVDAAYMRRQRDRLARMRQ